jgi:hypothetical protein
MLIDLSDEEAVALLALLERAIEIDRYLLSPCARRLLGIRPKLLGQAPAPPANGPPRAGWPRR